MYFKIKKTVTGIDPDALQLLINGAFPGNIRELENEVERFLTLADESSAISIELLSPRFHSTTSGVTDFSADNSLKEKVETLEKKLIIETLKDTKGNILRAAEKLKLSRAGLHKKLNRYKIESKQ